MSPQENLIPPEIPTKPENSQDKQQPPFDPIEQRLE
jgi:hypothetical protein